MRSAFRKKLFHLGVNIISFPHVSQALIITETNFISIMKNIKFLFYFLLLAGSMTFVSCGDDDSDDGGDPVGPMSIVETAIATDNLSILVDALVQTGLDNTLNTDGPFTVLAPTNDAFQNLLDSNPAWNSLSDIDNATLTNVLLFHVLGAEVRSTDLSDSYVTTAALGPNDEQISLQIDVTGGVVFNGSATPTAVDVETSNGIVHIIDEVMLPPSVVDHALNNSAFSSLVAALTRADLTTDFVSVLSGTGPFTVFAPTDAAFQDLINSNPAWNSLADIPVDLLQTVLTYHVVSGANVQSDMLSDGQTITTLNEGTFDIDLSNGVAIATTSGQSVNVALPNVQGWNGVVHAIDAVLLP